MQKIKQITYFMSGKLAAPAHIETPDVFFIDVTNVGCGISLFPQSLHKSHFVSVPNPVAKDKSKFRKKIKQCET